MILIIDLFNLAHRASHAYHELWSPKSGIFTGLYYGVFHMLERYVDELQPDMVWLVSDPMGTGNKHNWRKDVYPGYKDRASKRNEEQQKLYAAIQNQLPHLRQALWCLNISWMEQAGLEADDIVGWLCKQFGGVHKIILSTDKDMLQLVDEYTAVYYPGHPQRWFKQENFKEQSRTLFKENKKLPNEQHFMVSPAEWFEFRLLTGDDSDTIDGVPKCGDTRAKEILKAGGYKAWLQSLAGKTLNKTETAMSSPEAQQVYERNQKLMSLTPPHSPAFVMNNPLCRAGTASPDGLLPWLQQMDFSTKEGSVITRLQRSPLLKKLSGPYVSLRSW